MCGICGIYYFDKEKKVNQKNIISMMKLLHHRGPDDEGIFLLNNVGLGHKRLSIIDLKTGKQPIFNESGDIVVIFNGEIYNYIELKKKYLVSHKFKTNSDTEVIVHLYEEFGIDFINKLDGMFTIALYDLKQQKLFLIRDHFGIKPLYYYNNHEKIIFASEIKALKKNILIPKLKINNYILYEYFIFQYYLGKQTLFENITRLLPGYYIEINQQGLFERKYWDLDISENHSLTEEEYKEHINYLLKQSVTRQLRSDVPLGCHLSGGIDTSTIISYTREILGTDTKIDTFTAGFGKAGGIYDDSTFAKISADYFNTHHHLINLNKNDFFNSLKNIFYYFDDPCAGEGAVPQYFVSKLAAKNVKVVLGGQGADEMFGGYIRYYIFYYYLLEYQEKKGIYNSNLSFKNLIKSKNQLKNYHKLFDSFGKTLNKNNSDLFSAFFSLINRLPNPQEIFRPEFLNKVKDYNPIEKIKNYINKNCETSWLNRILYFEFKNWLQALLTVEDRVSMAFSLESRVPFLNKELCEFVFSIPDYIKIKNGITKYVLKETVKDRIPENIVSRNDKVGFPVPLFLWKQNLNKVINKSYLPESIFKINNFKDIKEYDRKTWAIITTIHSLKN